VIKVTFCQPKKVGIDVWVLEVFFVSFADIQLAMKSIALDAMAKPIDLNPLT
jgi:hypothetical protein